MRTICPRSFSLRMRMLVVKTNSRLCAITSRIHPVIWDCICKSKCSSALNASAPRCQPAYPWVTTETPYVWYASSLCRRDIWADRKNRQWAFNFICACESLCAISERVRLPPSTMLPKYLNCVQCARMHGCQSSPTLLYPVTGGRRPTASSLRSMRRERAAREAVPLATGL